MIPLSNMKKNRMFEFITTTWNPFVGCHYNCKYCWARRMAKRNCCIHHKSFVPHFHEEQLDRTFAPRRLDFECVVFVCDMGDIWWAGSDNLQRIFNVVEKYPKTKFLFQTKGPMVYHCTTLQWPSNSILGTTMETDLNTYNMGISEAPAPRDRLADMLYVEEYPRFVSIEPILEFNLKPFLKMIRAIDPTFGVAIGYDNYRNKLFEPSLKKTLELRSELKRLGYRVFDKTLREAWNR